jgi:hypothetical protein
MGHCEAQTASQASSICQIDVEDIKGATERPRKDELAVASDGAVGSDTMGAL